MTYQPATISDDLDTLPQLPGWVISGRAETTEIVAFRSGAALTVLDQLVSDPRHGVPLKLLANRLALELERMQNHLGDLGALGNDAGFLRGQWSDVQARFAAASAPSWRV